MIGLTLPLLSALHRVGSGFFQFGFKRFARRLCRLSRQHQRCGPGVGPVGAQWFHHGGQHEPFDVGARGVVRAQRVPLGGVKRSLQ